VPKGFGGIAVPRRANVAAKAARIVSPSKESSIYADQGPLSCRGMFPLLGPLDRHGRRSTLACMADDFIVSDVEILGGKPCVRGTRLSVEFLLELAASGATQADILAQYPQVTTEGLAAAFRYAADALRGEQTWELRITA